MKRRIVSAWLALTLLACVPACAWAEDSADTAVLIAEDQFTAGDLEPAASEDAMPIVLASDASDEGTGFTLQDGVLTITDGGSYLISGEVQNGQILINAGTDDKVRLLLNGLTLTADSCAAIEATQADKVFITVLAGSENTLAVSGAPDSFGKADAALWADCTLTINGGGALRVSCPEGHGVKSTDSLKITGSALTVEAGKRGLSGKDSVRIGGGDITVVSGTDAVRATREDPGKLGYIYVSGGTVQLTTQGDGFSAEGAIQVDGGEITVKAGERSEAQASSGAGGKKGWSDADANDDAPSQKGMKADSILIRSGTLSLDTADDGLHATSSLAISGGDSTIATGDDALHSDKLLTITGGRLEITACYEGIEGETILIEGGSVDLSSNDDGINATGSMDGSAFGRSRSGMGGSSASLTITGGEMVITARGDGIDSNGSLTIGGGSVSICGAADSGEVPTDYSGTGVITGGTLLATGSSTRMLQSFGEASTQPTAVVTLQSPHNGGDTITLLGTDGSVLTSFTPAHGYQLVIVSCPVLAEGTACTLTAGSEQRAVTVGNDSFMAESGFGRGGFGKGNGGFGRGGHEAAVSPDNRDSATPGEEGADEDGYIPESWMGGIGL